MKKVKLSISLLFLIFCLIILGIVNIKNDKVSVNAASDNYNIVSYNYVTSETSYLYYENSIWAAEQHSISSFINNENVVNTIEDKSSLDTTISPYKFVCWVSNNQGTGTAFFIGTNVLLTAGHCVYNKTGFVSDLKIYPGKNDSNTPYGYFKVKKVYVQKEYYLETENNYDYDWAVMIIDTTDNTGIQPGGNLGKIDNYSSTNETLYLLGYPDLWLNEAVGNISYYTEKRLEYTCKGGNGFSGGPVMVKRDSGWYVIGIHTASNSSNTSWGGTRINDLIYFLTNSLLADNAVEIKNFYLNDTETWEQYNCVGKLVANPAVNTIMQTSTTGDVYANTYSTITQEYYTTGTDSALIQVPFDYYRAYNLTTGTYSSVRRISTTHSTSELNAKYKLSGRSSSSAVISTEFDQSTNKWKHGGSSIRKIKGTIVYGNYAKNIEVDIPLIGMYKSKEVVIDSVTFQLRCGPNYVSLKASKSISCNEKTKFFAFAVA